MHAHLRFYKKFSILAKQQLWILAYSNNYESNSHLKDTLTLKKHQKKGTIIKDITSLERIQRRATKYMIGKSMLDYKERLILLNMLPLVYHFELYDICFFISTIKNPDYHFPSIDQFSFSNNNTCSSSCLKLNHIHNSFSLVHHHSFVSQVCLLKFPAHCLCLPESANTVAQKLTVALNGQIRAEKVPAIPVPSLQSRSHSNQPTPLSSDRLASKVSQKLEVNDFRGAVCLTSSSDLFAEPNNSTLGLLCSKHPAPDDVPPCLPLIPTIPVPSPLKIFPKASVRFLVVQPEVLMGLLHYSLRI